VAYANVGTGGVLERTRELPAVPRNPPRAPGDWLEADDEVALNEAVIHRNSLHAIERPRARRTIFSFKFELLAVDSIR
jgi:hypothetical protein